MDNVKLCCLSIIFFGLSQLCLADDPEPVVSNKAFLDTSGSIRRSLVALHRQLVQPLERANTFIGKHLDRIIFYIGSVSTFTDYFISMCDFIGATFPQLFDPPPKGRLYAYVIRALASIRVFLLTVLNALKAMPSIVFARPVKVINQVFEFILKYIPASF
ncbi:uncharacterized protein LOC143204041 isoform X2 [Rhynchophorus ferrugineus]|uniref:uncharacterized protein LOC143204041 isoform X2 n=1 Tax=Rhynchophorus ferrugineus TaxID=354439 RepID=UPI003FCC4340